MVGCGVRGDEDVRDKNCLCRWAFDSTICHQERMQRETGADGLIVLPIKSRTCPLVRVSESTSSAHPIAPEDILLYRHRSPLISGGCPRAILHIDVDTFISGH